MTTALLLLTLVTQDVPPPSAGDADFNAGVAEYNARRYGAAVADFERALAADPDHPAAREWLVQSCLLVGDQFGQLGDAVLQSDYYRRALDANPGLIDDPSFQARYRAATTMPLRPQPIYHKDEYEVENIKPREGRMFGISIANGLAGGPLGIQIGVLVGGHFNPTLTFGSVLKAIDFGFKYIPLESRWSPYIGAGFWHRVDAHGCDLNNVPHLDLGFTRMTKSGAAMNLGVGFMVTHSSSDQMTDSYGYTYGCSDDLGTKAWLIPIPQLDFGWYF
jgi:tetratricopeptide repeat protein